MMNLKLTDAHGDDLIIDDGNGSICIVAEIVSDHDSLLFEIDKEQARKIIAHLKTVFDIN